VNPLRSGTGRRAYSQSEIDRLQTLVKLVNLGHAIGTVAPLTARELGKLLRKSTAPSETDLAPDFLRELRPALERFDIPRVSNLLDQKRTALGTRLFLLEVLVPLLGWIGFSIDRGRLGVAHEHALSAVLKDQIYQNLRYGTKSPTRPGTARFVLATPEDDLHEFGAMMGSALVAHYGLSSHFLGANLPAEALAIAVKAIRGNVVILGNSPAPPGERKITFDAYLSQLHLKLPEAVEVWIGGTGPVPHLRRVMRGRRTRVLASLHELDVILAKTGG